MSALGSSASGGSASPAAWPIGDNPLIGWAILAWHIPGAMPPSGKWFTRATSQSTCLLAVRVALPHCTITSSSPLQAARMNSWLRMSRVGRLDKRRQE